MPLFHEPRTKMIPASIQSYFSSRFQIIEAKPVGGGCINDCYRLDTSAGPFFLKLNDATILPGMFETEMEGLKLLASTSTVNIPRAIETGEVDGISLLLMEFIESGAARKNSMYDFGRQLARLHTVTNRNFGLEYDNYIGSLKQFNQPMDNWPAFFAEQRLMPLMRMAFDKHLIQHSVVQRFEKLFVKMDSLFPIEKPALLHGDLWSGNYLISRAGETYLVDPAVYYGHREMDIAMTRLFGSFSG